jgi:hypothetical protein
MEKIEPTNKAEKYKLEDKDYLLINAIRELTRAINMLRNSK